VKYPGLKEETSWGQDLALMSISGNQICSIWIPLDFIPADECMKFVSGSHLWPLCSHNQAAQSNLPGLPDIDASMEILSWDLEPGDCIMFDSNIVHSCSGNIISRKQRFVGAKWCGDDARYDSKRIGTIIPRENIGYKHGDLLEARTSTMVRATKSLDKAAGRSRLSKQEIKSYMSKMAKTRKSAERAVGRKSGRVNKGTLLVKLRMKPSSNCVVRKEPEFSRRSHRSLVSFQLVDTNTCCHWFMCSVEINLFYFCPKVRGHALHLYFVESQR